MIAWWCATTTFWGGAAVLAAILALDVRHSRRARPSSPTSTGRRVITRQRPLTGAPADRESIEGVEPELVSR